MRRAEISRKTAETDITVTLSPDGGEVGIDTGIGFFDHMLTAFAFHGGMGLTLRAHGDLHVDMHHTVEDCGIVLGMALRDALGDRAGIARFGEAAVPMDEALCRVVVDISNRPYLRFDAPDLYAVPMYGFDAALAEEFFRALAINAGLCLHINESYGRNPHHIIEAMFKAAGRALRVAMTVTGGGTRSTKGIL